MNIDVLKKLWTLEKKLVTLMCAYEFGSIMSFVFGTIYVYQIRQNIQDVLIMSLLLFISAWVWFVPLWILWSKTRINMKYTFVFSYISYALSFACLWFLWSDLLGVYLYWAFFWLWWWLYWCVLHNYELTQISDTQRDIYSSAIEAGKKIVGILSPLIMTLLIRGSYSTWFESYEIGFWITILIYIASLYLIMRLPDLYPEPFTLVSVKQIKDHPKIFSYFTWSWIANSAFSLFITLIWLDLLKSDLSVWMVETFLWVFALWVILMTWAKRTVQNRYSYYTRTSRWMILIHILLAWIYSSWMYIVFWLVLTILKPLYTVSNHVYNLYAMDKLPLNTFSSTLTRETFLLISRVLSIALLMILSRIYEFSILLKISLVLIVISSWMTWWYAWKTTITTTT